LLFTGGIEAAADKGVRRSDEDYARQETGRSIIFWSSLSMAAINSRISDYTIDMLIYIAQMIEKDLDRPTAIQLLNTLKNDKADFVDEVRERRTEIRRQDADYLIQAMAMVALTAGDISAAAAGRLESVRNALAMSQRRFQKSLSKAREAMAGEPDA
jgi:hypothetical protein